jgi:glycosyltransferase involved in cell wall biosynthesis
MPLKPIPAVDLLFLAHPQSYGSGDWLHRIAWPAAALGDHLRVASVQTTHRQALQAALAARLLVIKMVVDPLMEEIILRRRQLGRATLYEISDDFTAFPPSLPLHAFYSRPEQQVLARRLAALADGVQFSSHGLQQKFADLNPLHVVMPNQIDRMPAALPPRQHRPRMVIGWSGSIGHLEDGRAVAESLAAWPDRRRAEVAVMAAPPIIELFRQADLRLRSSATGNMAKYLAWLRRLDLGIAWLEDSEFNRGRSDGRFLEFAMSGVVTVASAVGPWRHTIRDGENGFLFATSSELGLLLSRLLGDPALINRVRQTAFQEVATTRTHRQGAIERLAFYRRWLTHSTTGGGYEESIDPLQEPLMAAMQLHAEGDRVAALNGYQQLLGEAPEFYLLWQRIAEICFALGMVEDGQNFMQQARQRQQQALNQENADGD